MVARTRLNVTLRVHYLSCLDVHVCDVYLLGSLICAIAENSPQLPFSLRDWDLIFVLAPATYVTVKPY
jgi:hypothetical protein